ncbi:MAG: DNA polymerase III subunit gamma/tau [Epsilonproteobacteria bacterium]|nr:MAG: DNA polymerase III subunit gamma/tau [Campylobacterota bacterium]
MSLALARKYRPSTFDDLIGQDAVSQTLSQALDSDRLSHAYLFSGLRGSGKTSTARILAKALLCEKGQSSHPCDQCTHCIMANENRHMDIIEMDAASNRGIDDIKDLIEHTKYKPSSARYKIFIIDEVHMLTPQAFNALLKTLEEPPPFIKFILATTDPLKLPATILSRTQHFRFKKIPSKLVLQHLEHILNKESVEYEKEALEIIARSGAGSLRDSLTLLDQAIVYSKNYVNIATVTGMLGIIEPNLLENLLDNIMQKDQTEILSFVKLAADYETEMIIDELILFLKTLLLSQNSKIPPMIIERFFRILADSKSLLNLGGDGEFILALTLFKMMEALEIKNIDLMIKALEKELKGIKIPDSVTTQTPETIDKTEVVSSSKEEIQTPPILKKQIPEVTVSQSPSLQIPPPPAQIKTTEDEQSKNQSIHDFQLQYQQVFNTLIERIYDRDYDLGECFKNNIYFEGFENATLTWGSQAQGDAKKMLRTHWAVIKMFVQDLFGIETKIINIPQEASQAASQESLQKSSIQDETDKKKVDTPPIKENIPQANFYMDSASMIEEIEMKSSCIMPEAGETEAAKEKEPSNILDEPMIKEILNLFDPKKVRVKRKV